MAEKNREDGSLSINSDKFDRRDFIKKTTKLALPTIAILGLSFGTTACEACPGDCCLPGIAGTTSLPLNQFRIYDKTYLL
ncbi:MAG: hypothetical protein JXJ04_00665 [Spirochaetales bacterium]|nr:hypothetical protein [Spirochaetales bacterium]